MNLRQRKKAYIGRFDNPFRRFCWIWNNHTMKFIFKLWRIGRYERFKFNH